ncbi:MAG: HAMP domain-containing protein [Pyrinomonadaceae bacterium]
MLWFFLNLLVLAAIFLLLFNFRFAPQSPIFRSANYRIEDVTRSISDETFDKTRAERDEILKRYGEIYNVEFFLFDNTGKQIGGREITLPAEVLEQITAPDAPLFMRERINAENSTEPVRRLPPSRRPPQMTFYNRTSDPPLYWYGMRTMMFDSGKSEPYRARLLAASDSFFGHGLFFDPTPWLITAAIIVGVSLLFWFPFVRGITKNISEMTDATERIAEEKFDVRVSEKRADEIGRLGSAINYLASRLSGFVGGQKDFWATSRTN